MTTTTRLQAAAAQQAISTAQYLQHLAREGIVQVSHVRAILADLAAATGGAAEIVEEVEAAKRIIVCRDCDLAAHEADESGYCERHRDQPRGWSHG